VCRGGGAVFIPEQAGSNKNAQKACTHVQKDISTMIAKSVETMDCVIPPNIGEMSNKEIYN
jgi:hypothetical protein